MESLTRDGRSWTPQYLLSIDAGVCIGCGRCFKVCGRNVMALKGLAEGGELVSLDDEDDVERKVMALDDAGACIGCGACARVCPTSCQTHGTSRLGERPAA
jgi:Nif-specific ferredoxin III